MGHKNIEAEIYIGKKSSKEAYKVTKCLLLMLFYIPKENKSVVRSNEIKLSNALQVIRRGKKKFMRNIFSLKQQENPIYNVYVQLSKSILESRHSLSRQGEKVYTEAEQP